MVITISCDGCDSFVSVSYGRRNGATTTYTLFDFKIAANIAVNIAATRLDPMLRATRRILSRRHRASRYVLYRRTRSSFHFKNSFHLRMKMARTTTSKRWKKKQASVLSELYGILQYVTDLILARNISRDS